jgi:hypothetical protein
VTQELNVLIYLMPVWKDILALTAKNVLEDIKEYLTILLEKLPAL